MKIEIHTYQVKLFNKGSSSSDVFEFASGKLKNITPIVGMTEINNFAAHVENYESAENSKPESEHQVLFQFLVIAYHICISYVYSSLRNEAFVFHFLCSR